MNTESNSTLRVRIAEVQGWTQVHECTCKESFCGKMPNGEKPESWPHIPKYDEDLNCCTQLEAGLTEAQHAAYRDHLWMTCGQRHRLFTSATARQRCLAYLATINPQKPL